MIKINDLMNKLQTRINNSIKDLINKSEKVSFMKKPDKSILIDSRKEPNRDLISIFCYSQYPRPLLKH